LCCLCGSPSAMAWKRVWVKGFEGLDDDQIPVVVALLVERTSAKARKDYAAADDCAEKLRKHNVCWIDEKQEWYTSEPKAKAKAGFRPADSDGKAKVLSKKQLRNKRQAKKNKLKAKKMAEKFAASTGASVASS